MKGPIVDPMVGLLHILDPNNGILQGLEVGILPDEDRRNPYGR